MIDCHAVISPKAKIGANVTIGPFSVIGDDVEIGDGTWVGPHVVINGPTVIGKENKIFQFSSIGEIPQDKKFKGENSRLIIGDRNIIRENCTLNRGTEPGGGVTQIGDDNWIMAYVHIAHDCIIGNQAIFANSASLAGHVTVEDYVILGGFTLVHQFCKIGAHSFSAMNSVISKDVPPYVLVSGHMAKPYGLNTEGLQRRGYSAQELTRLKSAYKTIYRSGLKVDEAVVQLGQVEDPLGHIAQLVDFIKTSSRGIIR